MDDSQEAFSRRPDRDRNADGLAESARPRDGLGRPLPYGAVGEPVVADDPSRSTDEVVRLAQEYLDRGRPFHAHEVLEGAWKSASTSQRPLWQGLAQLAVGLTHQARGNPNGARSLIDRGRANLVTYVGQSPQQVDVLGVIAWCDRWLTDPESAGGLVLGSASS